MCASLCSRIRVRIPVEQLSVDKYHSPVFLIIVIVPCDVLAVAAPGSQSAGVSKVGVN